MATKGLTNSDFIGALRSLGILTRLPSSLGVHVSGSSGSMALAFMLKRAFPEKTIHAYTYLYDNNAGHKLRKDIKKDLARIGIPHHELLGLPDNSQCKTSSSNRSNPGSEAYSYFESTLAKNVDLSKVHIAKDNANDTPKKIDIPLTATRELRISAIASAAEQYNITHFALGESLEDRIARSLYRLKRNSGLKGLSGFEPITNTIPSAMYVPRPIMSIHPLIKFTNEQLLETLKENRFADYPLTSPLTVQSVPYEKAILEFLSKLNNSADLNMKELSNTLNTKSLTKFVDTLARFNGKLEDQASSIVSERAILDPPTGSCFLDVRIPRYIMKQGEVQSASMRKKLLGGEYVCFEVIRSLCRKIFWKPQPLSTRAVTRILNFITTPNQQQPSEVSAGVLVCPPKFKTGLGVYTISREPFKKNTAPKLTIKLNEKTLFDNRFVVSVMDADIDKRDSNKQKNSQPNMLKMLFGGIPKDEIEFVVKPFELDDYKFLVKRIKLLKNRSTSARFESLMRKYLTALDHFHAHMPTKSRNSVPCVAIKMPNGDLYVAYVPCLGITLEPGLAVVSQQSLTMTESKDWIFY